MTWSTILQQLSTDTDEPGPAEQSDWLGWDGWVSLDAEPGGKATSSALRLAQEPPKR